MAALDPPPTTQTFSFKLFKDWFFKLWKRVIALGPFGSTGNPNDGGYSAAISMANGLLTNSNEDINYVGGAYIGMPNAPVVLRAGNSSAQSFASGTTQTVTGWTTAIDTAKAFNASTGVYTVPVAGFYRVYCHVLFTSGAWAANSTTTMRIDQNGTNIATGGWANGAAYTGFQLVSADGVLQCAAGDTIVCQALQQSGATLTLYNGGPADALTWSQLSIYRMG